MIRAVAVVVVCLAAASACAGAETTRNDASAVVGIRARGCGLEGVIGTGVVVADGADTVVATSAHTVAGADDIQLERDDGSVSPATVVAFDGDRDVAILRSAALTGGRPLVDPATGQAATAVVWSPDTGLESFDTSVTRLLRVTIEDIYVEDIVERRAFEFDGLITTGDSGAPIFDDDGHILGIVYARSRERQVGFAVSTTEIRPVLATAAEQPVDTGRCL